MYQHGCRHFQTCEICRELTPEKRNHLANVLLKVQVRGLGGGFKHFSFSPLLGEMIQFDEHIFKWVAQPATSGFKHSFLCSHLFGV